MRFDDDRGKRDLRRPLRVVHVVRSLHVGGQEAMMTRLVLGLDRTRFHGSVLSLQGDPSSVEGQLATRLREGGIEVATMRAPADGLAPEVVLALARAIWRARADIVHTHNIQPLIYAGAASATLPGVRLVATAHGPRCWSGFRFESAVRKLAGRAPFVAVSDDLRERLGAMGWRGSPMVVIVNGVDTDALRAPNDRTAARRALGVSKRTVLVGIVGRLAEEKGHTSLFEAIRQLGRTIPNLELVVAGDGPLRAELEALAARPDLAGRVRFLGECTDVPALLGALDVFCLPSDTEGTSLSLLEAMACEVPVVASAVGGTPSALADGAAGWLVPPRAPGALAAAIASVLADPEERTRRIREARRLVEERFSLRTMVARYAELYTRVASG